MLSSFVISAVLIATDVPRRVPSPAAMREETERITDTAEQMKRLAKFVEAYAIDFDKYPDPVSIQELASRLEQLYKLAVPTRDSWDTPFRYAVSRDRKHYRITSAGADRQFERTEMKPVRSGNRRVEPKRRESRDPASDLMLEDLRFVQAPAFVRDEDD